MDITVLPWLASFFRRRITWRAVVESRPVVGSSKKIILGFVMSSTPIEVLFLSPPLIPLIKLFPTFVSAQLVRPNSLIRFSTLYCFSSFVAVSLRSAANWKHSLGVRVGSSASYCITYPICLQYGSTDLIG